MACTEVAAFLQTVAAHYISNIFFSQCHYSLVLAARQITNSLSPIDKTF